MSRKKYITSGGLAFTEKGDMEKLRRYSKKGWHVKKFTFMGYTLEEGEGTDYVYTIDYRLLDDDEEEEYYDLFSSAGWSHVTSEGNIHLFRAYPGTKPIYTDQDTTITKYENSSHYFKKWAVPSIAVTALLWIGVLLTSGILNTVLLTVAIVGTVFTFPLAWTMAATYRNKWEVEGRKGWVIAVKMAPYLLVILAVVLLFSVSDKNLAVYVLSFMVIGAVVFPTVIWLVSSLYHILRHN